MQAGVCVCVRSKSCNLTVVRLLRNGVQNGWLLVAGVAAVREWLVAMGAVTTDANMKCGQGETR